MKLLEIQIVPMGTLGHDTALVPQYHHVLARQLLTRRDAS